MYKDKIDIQQIQRVLKVILKDMGLESNVSKLENLKLDSMDFFEFITNLEEEFNIDINENEYVRCTSFNNIVLLIQEKLINKNFNKGNFK